jgi:hypothetical protein
MAYWSHWRDVLVFTVDEILRGKRFDMQYYKDFEDFVEKDLNTYQSWPIKVDVNGYTEQWSREHTKAQIMKAHGYTNSGGRWQFQKCDPVPVQLSLFNN